MYDCISGKYFELLYIRKDYVPSVRYYDHKIPIRYKHFFREIRKYQGKELDFRIINQVWKECKNVKFYNIYLEQKAFQDELNLLKLDFDVRQNELKSYIDKQIQVERSERERDRQNIRVLKTALYKKYLMEQVVNKEIAIKGAGVHTKELLKILDSRVIVKYIISNSNKEKMQFPILSNCESEEIDVDLILISSFKYREEMKKDLLLCSKKVVDIYEIMEKDGLCFKEAFFEYK